MKKNNYINKMEKLNQNKIENLKMIPKILSFLIILILVVFFIFNFLKNNNLSEILKLSQNNEKLLYDNNTLNTNINEYKISISDKSNQIKELTEKELELQKEVKTLQNKIKNLKSDYEKANIHADNFSSDQLSRYFADSLR
jgi:peptidoglycan hydrolase CwlO-like protein